MNDGSKKFIDWVVNKLKDDDEYYTLFDNAYALLNQYENMPKEEVIKTIVSKLTKAADEYGAPEDNIDKYDFDKELEMELTDLVFGWPLVRSYINRN